MVGLICFFIEEHLWFGCGASFVVKSTQECQDIFLNKFLRFLTANGFMLVLVIENGKVEDEGEM
jgi:hypothetical protein